MSEDTVAWMSPDVRFKLFFYEWRVQRRAPITHILLSNPLPSTDRTFEMEDTALAG